MEPNMSRVKMALRGDFLKERDCVVHLTHWHDNVKKWQLNIPNETRLRLLKLRSEFRK